MVIRSLPDFIGRGIAVRYVLIGIGEDQDYLANLSRQLGIADRVHLLGHVSLDDLPRWYNACDVFAMPNRAIDGDTEGFGMVFLEAAACGRPVLAGDAGGTGAAVVEGVTGRRVNGERAEDILSALACLLGEAGPGMGHNGYRRAQEGFTWEQVAAKTRGLSRSAEAEER